MGGVSAEICLRFTSFYCIEGVAIGGIEVVSAKVFFQGLPILGASANLGKRVRKRKFRRDSSVGRAVD
jgi:hypothetical protein